MEKIITFEPLPNYGDLMTMEHFKKMKIEIVDILIVHNKHSGDFISLRTNLPNGAYPFNETASLTMTIAKGSGEKYCVDNFPNVPVKIINS